VPPASLEILCFALLVLSAVSGTKNQPTSSVENISEWGKKVLSMGVPLAKNSLLNVILHLDSLELPIRSSMRL